MNILLIISIAIILFAVINYDKLRMLRDKLNEWVEKVVATYENSKTGDMIDRQKMIEDVEEILSEVFDKSVNYQSSKIDDMRKEDEGK